MSYNTPMVGEEHENSKALKAKAKQQLHDDLNIERAGLDNGRADRFGIRDKFKQDQLLQQRRRRDMARLTELAARLNDSDYCIAYQATWGLLEDVQGRLDTAILENADLIEDMESKAARLEDGTIVFQAEDGSFRTIDGETIRKDQQPSYLPADAPSWEEYRSAKERGIELAVIQTEEIDVIRHDLQDENTPPEQADFAKFQERLNAVDQQLDENNSPETAAPIASAAPTSEIVAAAAVGAPKI